MDSLRAKSRATTLVERLLRIPPDPSPPAGDPGSIRVFRAATGLYHYRLATWALKQASVVAGGVVGFVVLNVIPDFPYKSLVGVLEALVLAGYLVVAAFTYLLVHLDYQLRWYILTDRSLRIREGLVRVGEKTMSFANIQNVSIRQGPLQRLFGIADVEVRTAGGGESEQHGGHASSANMHLGYFRGVDNAEEIRDAILARVREARDTGLGDPDVHAPAAARDDVLAAARELLAEARALRAAS